MEEPNLNLLFLSVMDMTVPESVLPFLAPLFENYISVIREGVHSVNELNNLESSVKLNM